MTTPRRPPGRYDEPRSPLPRRVLTAGGVLLVLLLVGISFLAFQSFNGGPQAGVLGFNVVDNHTVEVRFEVRKKPGATVFCRVRARNREGIEVGAEEVEVGPSKRDTVVVVHRLVTRGRPSTGEVDGCSSKRRSP